MFVGGEKGDIHYAITLSEARTGKIRTLGVPAEDDHIPFAIPFQTDGVRSGLIRRNLPTAQIFTTPGVDVLVGSGTVFQAQFQNLVQLARLAYGADQLNLWKIIFQAPENRHLFIDPAPDGVSANWPFVENYFLGGFAGKNLPFTGLQSGLEIYIPADPTAPTFGAVGPPQPGIILS